MYLHIKAAAVTLGVLAVGFFTMIVLSNLPKWAALSILFGIGVYLIYSVALSGLKLDESIERFNSKHNDK
jgi:putative Mn2+ efflux pump MntP